MNWSAELALALVMFHVFYLLADWPSRQLARRIRMTHRRSAVAVREFTISGNAISTDRAYQSIVEFISNEK